ncbi:hypothetical protein D3C72_1033950 [compost metagenome]
MTLNVCFVEGEDESGDSLIERLPWSSRLWLAFQAGVTRRMDLLTVSRHGADALPWAEQARR